MPTCGPAPQPNPLSPVLLSNWGSPSILSKPRVMTFFKSSVTHSMLPAQSTALGTGRMNNSQQLSTESHLFFPRHAWWRGTFLCVDYHGVPAAHWWTFSCAVCFLLPSPAVAFPSPALFFSPPNIGAGDKPLFFLQGYGMHIVFSDRVHVPCPESALLVVHVLHQRANAAPLEGKTCKPKFMEIMVWWWAILPWTKLGQPCFGYRERSFFSPFIVSFPPPPF